MIPFVLMGAAGYFAVVGLACLYVYWPRLRYSRKRAKHLIQLTQTETEVAPEYKWATRDIARLCDEVRVDYRPAPDWRTQTFDSLSPEALEREQGAS